MNIIISWHLSCGLWTETWHYNCCYEDSMTQNWQNNEFSISIVKSVRMVYLMFTACFYWRRAFHLPTLKSTNRRLPLLLHRWMFSWHRFSIHSLNSSGYSLSLHSMRMVVNGRRATRATLNHAKQFFYARIFLLNDFIHS